MGTGGKLRATTGQAGASPAAGGEAAGRMRRPRKRLSHAERRAQILRHAEDFFAEHGLEAQTRALAEACGVSQRLLYHFFPTKAALLDEVYEDAILGPFKAVWFAQLSDRSRSVEERLCAFYADYFQAILTRKWLRLFLYSSLAEGRMAPDYIASTVMRLMATIVEETAHEQGVRMPQDQALVHEIGWTLHGAVSHFAIRRHLYRASQSVPPETVITMHVRSFLAGFAALVREFENSAAEAGEAANARTGQRRQRARAAAE